MVVLMNAARVLHEQRMPEQALALGRRHNTPWAAGLRGTAYLVLHQPNQAEKEFVALRDALTQMMGEYAAEKVIEFHRMQAASYAGRYDRVIEMWPNLPRSFWSIYALDVGRAYLHTERFKEAEHHLRLASMAQQAYFSNVDMQAQHNFLSWALAQFYLGQVLEKTGRRSNAAAHYRAFLKLFEHSSAALPQIGIAQAALAQFELSARGELLFRDEFNGNALEASWTDSSGSWRVADGSALVSQLPDQRRQAERRRTVSFRDAIFELAFRLDGASRINLSIGSSLGNLCRVHITRGGLSLQLAESNRLTHPRPQWLGTLSTDIEPGKWHKVVVEMHGKRMLAQLDGKHTVAGESPRVDVDKTDFGLLVTGASASFDYVRIYQIGSK
jgi:tetratricopeptide (TPR) repeat protein